MAVSIELVFQAMRTVFLEMMKHLHLDPLVQREKMSNQVWRGICGCSLGLAFAL